MNFPGMPLIYKTRYYPPVSKCLQFWYYMDGVDNKVLAVNFHQEPSTLKQLLRIRGSQGSSWKRATVALKGHVEINGNPFYVRNCHQYALYMSTLRPSYLHPITIAIRIIYTNSGVDIDVFDVFQQYLPQNGIALSLIQLVISYDFTFFSSSPPQQIIP